MSDCARDEADRQALTDSPPDNSDVTAEDAANRDAAPHHPEAFSKKSFWKKVAAFAVRAGKKVIYQALVLYYCLIDSDTPKWVKAPIIGALGYFIFPADAIPDALPLVGFSDDLAVLGAAVAYVATHIKCAQRRKAEEKFKTWFR